MGKTLDELYNIGEEIYNTSPYNWDGNSRPNLNDYISPWAKYANYEEANSLYKKSRHYNDAIRYAKTMMEMASAQYMDDIAYWNERDERDYTDQSSQVQRYEDAGFNLGYMYGNIDSGNSAVGYNQGDVSINPNDTSNKSVDQLKQVTEVVSGVLSMATDLVKSGYDIRLTDKRTALTDWQTVVAQNQGKALAFQNQWTQILRDFDFDGNEVGYHFEKSIAFLSEKIGYELSNQELKRLSTFVKYCEDLYKNQSTDMVKELFGDLNQLIDGIDSKGVQALLRLLSVMAVAQSQK